MRWTRSEIYSLRMRIILCRLGAGPRGLLSYIRRGVCRFAGRSQFQLAAMGVSRVCLVLLLVGLSLCSPAFSYSHRLWKRQNGARTNICQNGARTICDRTPANLQQSFETNCAGKVDNATCERAWMAFTRAFARRNSTTVMARLVSGAAWVKWVASHLNYTGREALNVPTHPCGLVQYTYTSTKRQYISFQYHKMMWIRVIERPEG